MLPVVVFPFLYMLNLDVHGKALGYELNVTAEIFDQHARMAFDLLEAVIDSLVDLHELPVNRLKALVYRLESPVVPVQSLLNPAKPLVKILNKFLIHAAFLCEE